MEFIQWDYTLATILIFCPMTTASKTWHPTKHKQLYHHKSGIYYVRGNFGGKRSTYRSLKTKTLSSALAQLKEKLEDAAHQKELGDAAQASDKLTMSDLMNLRRQQLESDPSIKESTRHYWRQILASLEKSWPELPAMEARRVTAEQCQDWVRKNKGTGSASRFNNTLGALKTLFALAIKKGARRTNPAVEMKRKHVPTKDLSIILPTRPQFHSLVAAIRDGGGRFSKASADFVEFLAYTGVRKDEARWILWQHCDFQRGEILVTGSPDKGTKNSERRRIPMIQDCRALLERIQAQRGQQAGTAPVMLVNESQKAMDRAFQQLGLARLTHHDLRHYFATISIESGVDIPTVAKWLGHKDGGVLAMKIYGHLRNEHSLAAARKVSFAA